MSHESLFQRALRIAQQFSRIRDKGKELDSLYEAHKAEIEDKYKVKLSELDYGRNESISQASEKDRSAQDNIRRAMNALDVAEAKVPARYRRLYSPDGIVPREPDFQALNELEHKISDLSLEGAVKRIAGMDGYSLTGMGRDYFERIEAGRMYLTEERQRSADYLAYVTSAANAEYQRLKDQADRKKSDLMRQNDQAYAREKDKLRARRMDALRDPGLARFDVDLEIALRQLGAFESAWRKYEPSASCPDCLMIGVAAVPLAIPSSEERIIRERMPLAFSTGGGFCIPVTLDMSRPMRLLIGYEEPCKAAVMEGIQCILLKWIRSMPPYSFCITYIDPNDRGSNLGQLQKFEEITAWNLCRKVYASREDIARRLKELERFVDAVCARLAGITSVYEYNRMGGSVLTQHLIVLNDFPDNLDQPARETLGVLIHNAEKCGISMIFTKKGDVSEFPADVQDSFLKIQASASGSTVSLEGAAYDFWFDDVCPSIAGFVEQVKTVYNEGFRVDNRFAHYFSFSDFHGYRESTQSLRIPFAVDARKRLVELELGGAMSAHALLSGAAGSGKSTTLHMLIQSIILHYHPDDVELWLVDYDKVEFAEYLANRPPHVKLIGLERGAEFTFSLLTKVNDECQRRMELFKNAGVSDITEYKRKYGVRSIPRIILIVDEFHQMTQAIQNEPEYVLALENILSEYRKFGLSCVFSDQAIGDGLRGLTEKGKNQIRVRIAMANALSEIRETLAIDSSFYDDALNNKINRMDKGDVIFKRMVRDASGEMQIVVDKYRTVLVTRDERAEGILSAKKRLGFAYEKADVLIVDGKERRYCDEKGIEKFEAEHGAPSGTDIPIYVGTPASLDPCFRFLLQERLDSNVMVIGADTQMRASVVLHTIRWFSRVRDHEIVVFADKRDELYTQFRGELERLADPRMHVLTSPEAMCPFLNGLLEEARDGKRPRTLLVWLGIESIGADFSMYPDKAKVQTAKKAEPHSAVSNLMDEIDTLLADFEEASAGGAGADAEKTGTSVSAVYDARDDISKLIAHGARFGVHSLVTYPSVKMLGQSRFVKPECFEHKIAFAMSRDDWSSYLERVRYLADLDNISAVYYDGGSSVRVFRPYRLRERGV